MLQIGKPPLQTPEGRTFNSRFFSPNHECENLWCAKGGSLQDNLRKCRKGVLLTGSQGCLAAFFLPLSRPAGSFHALLCRHTVS